MLEPRLILIHLLIKLGDAATAAGNPHAAADAWRLALTILEELHHPRSALVRTRIAANQADQSKLVTSLKPTNINFKTFLPMLVQQKLSPDFPSHYSQSYLHDRSLSRKALS